LLEGFDAGEEDVRCPLLTCERERLVSCILSWEEVEVNERAEGTYIALSKNIITPPMRKNPPIYQHQYQYPLLKLLFPLYTTPSLSCSSLLIRQLSRRHLGRKLESNTRSEAKHTTRTKCNPDFCLQIDRLAYTLQIKAKLNNEFECLSMAVCPGALSFSPPDNPDLLPFSLLISKPKDDNVWERREGRQTLLIR
jgi:hypothetical protein